MELQVSYRICTQISQNLDWFVRMFLEGELHRFGGAGDAFYAWLNGEVSRARADHGVLFYPFLFDSNEGHGINASLKNLTAANTKGEILRAVYEGVVFSHKKHIDNLLAGRDAPVSVRLAGGVAKSDVWAQMFADAIGIKAETVPDREQGCFGAALATGVAAGVYADYDNAVRETARECKIYYPDPAMHEVYEKKYAQYRANIG